MRRRTAASFRRSTRHNVRVEECFPCPCCGNLTLDEEPPGTYDICKACGWEDDNVQFHDPEYRGGANTQSLREARVNYAKHGSATAPPRPKPKTRSELPRSADSE